MPVVVIREDSTAIVSTLHYVNARSGNKYAMSTRHAASKAISDLNEFIRDFTDSMRKDCESCIGASAAVRRIRQLIEEAF